ncbi:MAG: IS1182 family transposase [Micropepsaceae bacterium]
MSRFVESEDRDQGSLLPARIEEFIEEDNPARVIEAFIEGLDLKALGFEVTPAVTGRPAYHPALMLKIYLYGYMNRVQSSRRLEQECRRNLELIWLTGRLAPDFKTIADFRRDNGAAIAGVCARFIIICREIGLFRRALAIIDGSRFKGVNSRERNFTRGKVKKRIAQVEDAISRYLQALDAADRQESFGVPSESGRLRDKLKLLDTQMQKLKEMEKAVEEAPDHQVSLTDPDARSMSTGGRSVGVVGYNVQTAVDPEHHLIISHEVTNKIDRGQLPHMAAKAKDALKVEELEVIADRGYFAGVDIVACKNMKVDALAPRSHTSNAAADGRFDKDAFIYQPDEDAYRCPAGQTLSRRSQSTEAGLKLIAYWTKACPDCPIKTKCTIGSERRVKRWEHEHVIEAMQKRMKEIGDPMGLRRQVVEHPFGTIKSWMGATHFLCKGFAAVSTEMALHVLAYNIRRVIAILGPSKLREAFAAA